MSQSNDADYVHMQFYDEQRLEEITEVKEDYDITWKEMLEFGRCYLEAVDKLHTDDPEFVAELLLRSDLEASLELETIGDVGLMDLLNRPDPT